MLPSQNIPVREDCVVSEPVISFLFPIGKIFQLFFKNAETKRRKNVIVSSGETIFLKKLERKGTVDGDFGNNPGRREFWRIWRIGA